MHGLHALMLLGSAAVTESAPHAAPSFADAVERAVRAEAADLAGRSDAWADKRVITSHRELVETLAPSPGDLAELFERLEALAATTTDAGQRWRFERLLAEVALDRQLPAQALRHALRAIETFPTRGGPATPKHSQLPHLVNLAVEATWIADGADVAQKFFLEWLRANPGRIEPWLPWWWDRLPADEHAAFARKVLGRPWPDELLHRVQGTWSFVAGRSIGELRFRDKNAFSHALSDLEGIVQPRSEELAAAEELVRSWAADLPADPHREWRVLHLRGAIAERLGQCERAHDLYLDAMNAYPSETYSQPSKQSYFQHLLNDAGALARDLRGREMAEAMALEHLARDPRLAYFHVHGWSERSADSPTPDRDEAFRARVIAAYRAKADRFPELATQLARARGELEAEVPRLAVGHPQELYFLHGLGVAAPPAGHGLLVVLPGGDGGRDFGSFVSSWSRWLGDGWLVAQLVAPKWTDDPAIVWPTRTNGTAGMRFATEDFIADVVEDAGASAPIDPERIVLLGWSSGGPPVQAAMLAAGSPFRKAAVFMSVFKPDTLPPLSGARDQSWCLVHSPEDAVCPFRMAEQARDALSAVGARVRLETYAGSHGWDGLSPERLKECVAWLVAGGR